MSYLSLVLAHLTSDSEHDRCSWWQAHHYHSHCPVWSPSLSCRLGQLLLPPTLTSQLPLHQTDHRPHLQCPLPPSLQNLCILQQLAATPVTVARSSLSHSKHICFQLELDLGTTLGGRDGGHPYLWYHSTNTHVTLGRHYDMRPAHAVSLHACSIKLFRIFTTNTTVDNRYEQCSNHTQHNIHCRVKHG